jgi:hypothetical protein
MAPDPGGQDHSHRYDGRWVRSYHGSVTIEEENPITERIDRPVFGVEGVRSKPAIVSTSRGFGGLAALKFPNIASTTLLGVAVHDAQSTHRVASPDNVDGNANRSSDLHAYDIP